VIVLGLTGSLGAGKTTVARMFSKLGARVLDADKIAHKLIGPGMKGWRAIVLWLGKDILNKNQTVNREKLAEIVFKNKKDLKKLEKIIHPLVIGEIKKYLDRNKTKNRVVIIDAPLLIEAGLKKKVDKLIVVKLDRKKQIARVLRQSRLSGGQILRRIKLQLPQSKKIAMADYIIDNNGNIKNTASQVKKIWREVKNG
jgi:dephospho-CoA kinase